MHLGHRRPIGFWCCAWRDTHSHIQVASTSGTGWEPSLPNNGGSADVNSTISRESTVPPPEPLRHLSGMSMPPLWGAKHETREKVLCFPIYCSSDLTCTVHNRFCCSFYNFQMLLDFDRFMQAHGLQDEYLLVYGSALGALRNQTILPYTQDVDVGISLKAIEVLHLVQGELWRAGYTFWHDRWMWRICPHYLHPSPVFREAMVPVSHEAWEAAGNARYSVYLDGYMMWPAPPHATYCNTRMFKGADTAREFIDSELGESKVDSTLAEGKSDRDSSNMTAKSSTDADVLWRPSG